MLNSQKDKVSPLLTRDILSRSSSSGTKLLLLKPAQDFASTTESPTTPAPTEPPTEDPFAGLREVKVHGQH